MSSRRRSTDDVETDVHDGYGAAGSRAFSVSATPCDPNATALSIDERTPGPLYVGKSESASLRLADPTVSRRHLALSLCDQRLRVQDLGSKNGTFVGGVRIVEALLEGGEEVALGNTRLRVTAADKPLEPADLGDPHFGELLGESAAMRRLFPLFHRLSRTAIPVVIEGETGTGKEALAEALHANGPRAAKPFVVFDCNAVASNQLEAELFGQTEGAFPGALARSGTFREADGGTLLIDEIADLDLSLQPKLLRALERSEIRAVGSDRPTPVDVRVLAATRRDLDREVAEGRFRDDLFHRLCVARVALPPLRERGDDVIVLARKFYRDFVARLDTSLPPEAPAELLRRLRRDSWPGNVRELRNAVARAVALHGVLLHDASDLPPVEVDDVDLVSRILAERQPLPVARARLIHAFERRYVEDILARHQGKVTRAAKEAAVSLRYFQLLRQRLAAPAK